jgi:hypothetical protein
LTTPLLEVVDIPHQDKNVRLETKLSADPTHE